MITAYPYTSIRINGKEVSLCDIISGKVSPQSAFEQSTYQFIQRWFSETNTFTISTSGSTGAPKTITIKRSQMISSATLTQAALGYSSGAVALLCLDPTYIAGQMMLVRSFVSGLKIIAEEPSHNPFRNLPEENVVDFVAMVPYQMRHVVESSDIAKIDKVKFVIIGGAQVDVPLANKISRLSCRCYETYGMTETISHIALKLITEDNAHGYFTALPGITLGLDARRCLVVKVPYIDEEVVTNDLVEIVNTNSFVWLGRIDNIINTGGVKLSPEKIEFKIKGVFGALNLHQRYVISSEPDELLGEKIILVIESENPDQSIENSLFQHLDTFLARYERPRKIVWLNVFPETPSHKINRPEIKKIVAKQPQK